MNSMEAELILIQTMPRSRIYTKIKGASASPVVHTFGQGPPVQILEAASPLIFIIQEDIFPQQIDITPIGLAQHPLNLLYPVA